jgi:mannosyltransferase
VQPAPTAVAPAPTLAQRGLALRDAARTAPIWLWVAGLTLLGAVLRLHRLGAESFWFDEADIIQQARAPLANLLTLFTHAGENGPLYTLLLHFWLEVVGTREAAVRLLPAAFGVATIPLIYVTGKRLLNEALGLIAAGLLAVSPFHIWHSQDAKMYTLVVLVTLASTTLYLHALSDGRARWWGAYVGATWIALFTHGLAVLILLAQLIATPILWPRAAAGATALAQPVGQRRRRWAIALLALSLPFLPIAWERLYAVLVGNFTADWHDAIGPLDMLGVLFVKFAVNRAGPPWEPVAAALAGLLFGVGLLAWPGRARRPWAFLAVMWAAPIGLFYLLTLKVPLFEPRYLIIVLPFYLLFVAAGLLRLGRRALPLALAPAFLLVALDAVALLQINYNPQPQKEEWRQAMDYVRQHVRLRDVIIVHPGYLKTAVDLYYAPSCDVPRVPVLAMPPLETAGFSDRAIVDWLKSAITNHERAWIITSPPRTNKEDPQGKALQFFEGKFYQEARYYQFDVQQFIGVEIHAYAFNGQPRSWFPEPVYPQTVAFAGGFNFAGSIYEMRGPVEDQVSNATWLPLTLYWRFSAAPRPDQDYIISLRLIEDATGKEWAAYDQAPLNGYRPTTTFPAHDLVIDYADLFIPGNAPPGTYHVQMQVWPRCAPGGACWDAGAPRRHPGAPLEITGGDNVTPGADTVTLQHPVTVKPYQPCK